MAVNQWLLVVAFITAIIFTKSLSRPKRWKRSVEFQKLEAEMIKRSMELQSVLQNPIISSEEKKARQEQFLEWMADHWYRAKEWTNEDDQIRFVGFFQQTLRELKKFGLLGEHGLTLYEKKRQGGHQPQLPDQSDISQVQQQYLQKKNQDTPKVSSTFFTSTIFWLLILIFVGFNLLIWVYIHQGNNDQFQDLSTVKQPRKRKKRKKTLRVKTRKNSISRTLNRTRNKIKKPRKSNEQFSWKDS